MAASDSEVEKARTGDRAAFDALYERYGRPLFLHLTGLLGNRHDAEDALQAAFLRAWTHLPGLRRPERFGPWLFRIGKNAARDAIRKRRLWPRPIDDGDDVLNARHDEPDSDADVKRVVQGLKPATRSVLLLRAVQGWSTEETAAVLGESPATVRRRLARAVVHLRAIANGRHHDER